MTTTNPPMTGLAAAEIATLDGIIKTLANRPDVAPLIEYMFLNFSQPLGSLSAPHTAMDTLAEAFAENGALIERSDTPGEYGVDIRFRGGCGALWFHAPAGRPVESVPAPSVVVAHNEVPDGEPDDTESAVEVEVETSAGAESAVAA